MLNRLEPVEYEWKWVIHSLHDMGTLLHFFSLFNLSFLLFYRVVKESMEHQEHKENQAAKENLVLQDFLDQLVCQELQVCLDRLNKRENPELVVKQ